MRSRLTIGMSATTVLCLAASSFGWNRTGHMLVALIAYEDLSPAERQPLVDVLRKHPRFQEDFQRRMPPLRSREDQDRWIFIQAATWPDIARGFKGQDKKYHHPS